MFATMMLHYQLGNWIVMSPLTSMLQVNRNVRLSLCTRSAPTESPRSGTLSVCQARGTQTPNLLSVEISANLRRTPYEAIPARPLVVLTSLERS